MQATGVELRLAAAAADERRAEIVSWAIAIVAGAAWLTVVQLSPVPADVRTPPIVHRGPPIDWAPERDPETRPAERGGSALAGTADKAVKRVVERAEIAAVFAAAAGVQLAADVGKLFQGATVSPGTPTSVELSGGKAPLSMTGRPTTPGLASMGGGDASVASAGTVTTAGGAVSHTAVRAHPLPAVSAPALDGSTADPAVVGDYVRGHIAQLQGCYAADARASGGALAGVVTLRLTLGAGGAVRDAEIVRRTWDAGAGASTERCLLATARRWRIPSGAEGATVTVPVSFTASGQ